MCRAKKKKRKKNPACFSSICYSVAVSSDGGRLQVPICRSREEAERREAAGEDGAHSLTTLSSGSNRSTPGKTYPDVLLVGSPPPPTQTHIYGPHMGYISWRLGLRVPISPHVHMYSPTVHVVPPELGPYEPLAA